MKPLNITRLLGGIALAMLFSSFNLNAGTGEEQAYSHIPPEPPRIIGNNNENRNSTFENPAGTPTPGQIDSHFSAPVNSSSRYLAGAERLLPSGIPTAGINPAHGTVYYVSITGDDTASGTKDQPWRNIQRASEVLEAGDTLVVSPGIYHERIRPVTSGTQKAPVTFLGYGAIIEGNGRGETALFSIKSKSHIHIEGFEFRHSGNNGIAVIGSDKQAAIGITIKNVTIHDTKRNGIMISGNTTPSYTKILNSTIYRTQLAGIVLWKNYGGYFLVEGNDVSAWQGTGNWDGIEDVDTPYTVIRNNTVHDGAGKIQGVDYIDVGGDQTLPNSHTHHVLVEKNLIYKTTGPGAIKMNNRPKHAIMRYNRSWKVPIVFYEPPHTHVTVYHNTVVDTESHALQLWNKDNPNKSFGGIIIKNNIFAFAGKGIQHGPLKMDGSVNAILMINNLYRPTAAWNWVNGPSQSDYYQVASNVAEYQRWRKETNQEPGNLGIRTMLTKDEIFTDLSNLNFSLAPSSPGINQAAALTHVKGFGTGNTLKVDNSDYFFDGYNGLTKGDLIEIGQQGSVRILNINEPTNTLTIDREITWREGDPVYLAGKKGPAPDIGAVESY